MNPSILLLNNKPFSYEHIKAGDYNASSPFEEHTLSFCKQWLSGQTEFEQETSGSTGKPKLIKITRAQMQISAEQTVSALNLKANDTALVCVNPAFIAGKMMLVRAFEHQLKIIIVAPSLNPLEKVKVPFHFAAMIPAQIAHTLKNKSTKQKLKNCKAILVGGAPVSSQLATEISKLHTPIYATYGMTETVSHIALKRLSIPNEDHFTAIGDVKLQTNNQKQLLIKGSITNNKELITNDRVKLLSSSTFKWLGRIGNVVNSGGIKIQLEEVEESITLIFSQLGVENRFFLAKKVDKTWGEVIILYIENNPQLSTTNLLATLKNNLKKYTCPKEVIYVRKFNETSTGKINKPLIISLNS